MSKKTPRYLQIKQMILQKIHEGEWQAGEAIAPELTLAQQFGVSRMTVNRALKELSEENVLERRQGSGTFVTQRHFSHTFVEIRNIAHDIQAQDHLYQAQVLEQRLLEFSQLPDSIQAQFCTPVDKDQSQIATVKIIHFADNVPLQFEERWVNHSKVGDFLAQDFTQVNTSEYLIAHAPLQGGEYTISAKLANKVVAKALSIEVGAPVLLLNRKTLSQDQVLTVVNMWYAGERYHFQGTL
ncbi:UTRA domain-containing protein [bacterium M00.F.Ca.ET.230.01.1.1]|nr:UTRA domain-containing protein [bacterium M00.F.Ca.ET.230.01.1.1]